MFEQEAIDFTKQYYPVVLSYDHLLPYGIFEEDSDFRAHVAPKARCIYVFQTKDMIEDITKNEYERRPARQNGCDKITAEGFIVPYDRPYIRPVMWVSKPWWERFCINDDTTTKGSKAVEVVMELMQIGRFPFWVMPEKVTDIKIDISGRDITVAGRWKTQVKCDFTAGPREQGCTGNLFVQFAECNPLKKY